MGSYFGSVLCVLNVEKDNIQKTDYLLVGAPYFHRDGEEGKVYVYKLHQVSEYWEVNFLNINTWMTLLVCGSLNDFLSKSDICYEGYKGISTGYRLEKISFVILFLLYWTDDNDDDVFQFCNSMDFKSRTGSGLGCLNMLLLDLGLP